MMRAQILRHQRHRRAVAAMARHDHQLADAGSRDALADRHPLLQRDIGRQRQRARIIDMFGGNADRLQRQKGDGERWQATARAPAPDRPRRSGRRFPAADAGRAARSPPAAAPRSSARRRPCWRYRASGSRSSRGAERLKPSSEAFLWMNLQGSLLDTVIRTSGSNPGDVIHVHCLPSWARTIDGVQP